MTLYVSNLTTDTPADTGAAVLVSNVKRGPYSLFFKRVVDLVLVVISLPVVLPLILLIFGLLAAIYLII